MKPADLLDPEKLPVELRWLAEQHKLQPNDPVFLLLAWHWEMTHRSTDSMRAATLELRVAIESRTREIKEVLDAARPLQAQLEALRSSLESEPATVAQRFADGIEAAAANAVKEIESISPVVRAATEGHRRLEVARARRDAWASLLAGFILGLLASRLLGG